MAGTIESPSFDRWDRCWPQDRFRPSSSLSKNGFFSGNIVSLQECEETKSHDSTRCALVPGTNGREVLSSI